MTIPLIQPGRVNIQAGFDFSHPNAAPLELIIPAEGAIIARHLGGQTRLEVIMATLMAHGAFTIDDAFTVALKIMAKATAHANGTQRQDGNAMDSTGK